MRKRFANALIIIGVVTLISALGLTLYNFWDNNRASGAATDILDAISGSIPDSSDRLRPNGEEFIPDYVFNPYMEMPTIEYNGYKYIGVLSIPVIDIDLPVMDSWSYAQLAIAPCRYSGSAYLNNMVIAAHNYTGHFGRLKNLKIGDSVIFTDADGNVFNYNVSKIETLVPSAVEEMTSGSWDLTVFTCTVGGRTRVAVRCTLDQS